MIPTATATPGERIRTSRIYPGESQTISHDEEIRRVEPNLEMLFAEVLSDPDTCLRDGRFVELLGKAEVQQLVSAAKAILASRGGYVWPPQTTEYMETTLR